MRLRYGDDCGNEENPNFPSPPLGAGADHKFPAPSEVMKAAEDLVARKIWPSQFVPYNQLKK
jgi:hypothetical protein